MRAIGILKLIIGVSLAINAMVQILNHETWWFIQNVNLIFHEAGHVLFMFFGETLHILGGSLVEILIPILVTIHFIHSKQIFSAACTCWWSSTAFLSVSIYASDAQERVLPLITNDVSTHDWFNLLLKFNLLKYDDLVGFVFFCSSLVSVSLLILLILRDKDVNKKLLSLG